MTSKGALASTAMATTKFSGCSLAAASNNEANWKGEKLQYQRARTSRSCGRAWGSRLELESGDEPRQRGVERPGGHLAEDELGEAGPETAPPARQKARPDGGGGAAEVREHLEQQVIMKGADAVGAARESRPRRSRADRRGCPPPPSSHAD